MKQKSNIKGAILSTIIIGGILMSACAKKEEQPAAPVGLPQTKADTFQYKNIPPANKIQTEAERKAFAPDDKSPVAIVNAFNQLAFFDRKPAEAMRKYLSPDFIERFPDFAVPGYENDKEAAISIFEKRGWSPNDSLKDEIYLVFGDDELVTVFHKITGDPASPPKAFADIFRVKDGLIVEHWGVGQVVPANTSAKHSMF